MPWVRLDENFPEHPKVVAAGPLAGWLHVCALAYCNRHLTDGFIPEAVVRRLTGLTDRQVREAIGALEVQSMWQPAAGGYSIHDYLDYQLSSEDVKALRDSKVAAGRKGGKASAQARAKARGEARAKAQPQPRASRVLEAESKPVPSLVVSSKQPAAKLDPNGREPSPAQALTAEFWENADPKPTTKFIALRGIVARLLEAGWPEAEITYALSHARAHTTAAIEYVLNERREAQAKTRPKFTTVNGVQVETAALR